MVERAADAGHASAVMELHGMGADVDHAAVSVSGAPDSNTPVFAAALNGHVEVLEVLGRLGADLRRANAEGRTPMWAAAKKGHACAIELLGSMGAAEDARLADDAGDTPMFAAARFGQVSAIEALALLGAPTCDAGPNCKTPLQVAEEMGHSAAAATLLRLGGVV